MDDTARVTRTFQETARMLLEAAQPLASGIAEAAGRLSDVLLGGGKILACGNGGSAADAQHFAAEMLNRFERERPGLPALALTADSATLSAIANDYAFDEVFSKQVRALGQPGDALLALSTSGNSRNVVQAVTAAHERGVTVIALTGREGGDLAQALGEQDLELRVASSVTARVQEIHILIIHCLCDLIDRRLLGVQD